MISKSHRNHVKQDLTDLLIKKIIIRKTSINLKLVHTPLIPIIYKLYILYICIRLTHLQQFYLPNVEQFVREAFTWKGCEYESGSSERKKGNLTFFVLQKFFVTGRFWHKLFSKVGFLEQRNSKKCLRRCLNWRALATKFFSAY